MGKVVKIVATVAAIAAAIPTGGTSLLAVGLGGIGIGVTAVGASLIAAGLSVGASLLAKGKRGAEVSESNIDRLRANVDPRTPRKTAVGVTAMQADVR